jgi:RNA polymerase sigma factor (sigma-70 family)
MTGGKLQNVFVQIGRLVASRQAESLPDQELLARFLKHHDEAAFAALMERHGAMVLGVCRRVLKSPHDAEDACQAVFLVLARKAGSVRKQGSLGSWLHGVAWRVARKLRRSLARRSARENLAAAQMPAVSEPADMTWRDVLRVLDEELNRLPRVFKAPLVLCHLEGRTQDEAARELGWPRATVRNRLKRGREILRSRLARRGVTGSAVLAVSALTPGLCSAVVPPTLVVATVNASLAMATGKALPAAVPASVAALTREMMRAGLTAKLQLAVAMGLTLAAVGLVVLWSAGGVPYTHDPDLLPPRLVERWTAAGQLEGHKGHAWCVAFSPDGKVLASGAGGVLPTPGELRLWDTSTGQLLVHLDTPRGVRCVAFAPEGNTLATAEHDGKARLRDVKTGSVLRTFEGHKDSIDTVSFAPDGKLLATSSWDGTVKLWDTTTGKEVRTLAGQGGQLFAVAFGNNDTLAAGGANSMATVWDAATGRPRFTLQGHQGVVHWVACSPDGKTLATASWDKTVKLWAAATGEPLATLRGHTDRVLAVAFSPDGQTLASCSGKWSDRKIRPEVPSPGEVILWDVTTHKPRARLREHTDRVFGVSFSPDGNTLAVAGWDGSVKLWKREFIVAADPEPEAEPRQIANAGGEPKPVAGHHLAADVFQDFRGGRRPDSSLSLFGPDADEVIKPEAEGLRITPPTNGRQTTGWGVVGDFSLSGDFEVTATYTLLGMDLPSRGGGAGVALNIAPDRERTKWAKVGRFLRPRGDNVYVAECWTKQHSPADYHERFQSTTAMSGKLRLERKGSLLFFLVADGPGDQFRELFQVEFGAEDMAMVRFVANNNSSPTALDARLVDLKIRSGNLVVPPVLDTSKGSLAWALLGGLLLTLAAVGLGVWLYSRRAAALGATERDKQAKDDPAFVSLQCTDCGKKLRARAALAGKKVKCPQCGHALPVPLAGA